MRRLFTLTILVICGLWLLFSYVPSLQSMLPTIAFTGAFTGNGLWMAALAVLALIVFVVIQIWLVHTTVRTVRDYQSRSARPSFHIQLGAEIFWTALPIAMTIGLAWASFPLWLNFVQR